MVSEHLPSEALDAFLDGSTADAASIRAHLAGCPSCAAELKLLARSDMLLAEAVALGPVQPSPAPAAAPAVAPAPAPRPPPAPPGEAAAVPPPAPKARPAAPPPPQELFGSLLHSRKQGSQRALGGGVSVAFHILVLGTVAYISSRPPKVVDAPKGVAVAFVAKAAGGAPPPPPPPPPPAAHHKSHPKTTPIIKPTLVVPKVVPKEKPREEKPPEKKKPDPVEDDTPDDDDGVEGGVEGGVKGGVVGGVKGGVVGGVVGGVLGGQLGGGGGDAPVFFGEGMTKPVIDPEETPSFPWAQAKDALEAHVEGLILVQCVVTSSGTLKDCKILKRLPHIEDAVVLGWLAQWKFKPAMQGSHPISIKSYSIPIRIKIPNR